MLKLIKPGFFTTIQDLGRFSYRDKGVPVSGVMDNVTVAKLNMMLGNTANASVIEITMLGPTAIFEEDTFMVIGGSEMAVCLNQEPIYNYKLYKVCKGDVLSYGRLKKGLRNYLAVKGGFLSKKVLSSTSLYLPITQKSSLEEGDTIRYKKCSVFEPKITGLKVESFLDEKVLYVHKGPEFGLLNDRQLEQLFINTFTIAKENNRMAYQLHEKISSHDFSMLTSATLPGTVQYTPAGKLIILMKDGQTTGGYPRILQLSDKAISVVSQKKYGDLISFRLLQ